jgi:hypothetical protein
MLACIILLTNITGCGNIAKTKKLEGNNSWLEPNFPYSVGKSLSFAIKNKDIEDKYGLPQKTEQKGEYIYQLWDMKDESKIVAIFDKGYIFQFIWQYKGILSIQSFEDLIENESNYNDVLLIDPYAYFFSFEDISFSEHRVAGGKIIHIDYEKKKNDLIVKSIKNEDDSYDFYSLIEN